MRNRALVLLLDAAPKTWGTREEFHLRLSEALGRKGIQAILVYADELPEKLRERMTAGGAKVLRINYKEGLRAYNRGVAAICREYDVQAAHIRFFDYFSALPWIARVNGIKRVLFTEANSGEWVADSWKKYPIWLRTWFTTLPLTRAIAISEFIKQRLIEVGIPGRKIDVIYNGVDLERFVPNPCARMQLQKQFPIEPGEILLTTACVLLPWKHVEVLVKACGVLAQRGVPFRFFVAGDGPQRAELEALSQQLGVSDRIHWLGHWGNIELLFQGCDVFVLASVGEAFGNVYAEAMACGIPAVGADSGATAEIIVDGESGYMAESLNETSFADAIEKLRNEPIRREMGERARERVHKMFTVDGAVNHTMDVYASLGIR
jgi:glycosyltransferase involved in cell wall biosynthesis